LGLLRQPFPKNQISKLPKPYKKDSPKGKCQECGGYHGLPAAHLDYVEHAALTARLLDADPQWTWEPVAFDESGLPRLDRDGGLWIKLTVCGVTRLGYGDATGMTGTGAMKERIGDALRNAAMRFGAALELWHKGDLYIDDGDNKPENYKPMTGEDSEGTITDMQKLFFKKRDEIYSASNPDEIDIIIDSIRGSGLPEEGKNKLVEIAARRKFNEAA